MNVFIRSNSFYMEKQVYKKLLKKGKSISFMESCTGGALASLITNINGASDILKYSAVTYSNEFKIKMGVSKEVIDKYSVYSIETAREMAKAISLYANSNYGVGVTGKLNREDKNNLGGSNNFVYVSIYNNDSQEYHDVVITVNKKTKIENKNDVIKTIMTKLNDLI